MDQLIYPRPATRDLAIHTVLHDLQEDKTLFERYMSEPDAVLSAYDLDDDGRRLLAARDYRGLVARGVHPILVVQLERRIEWGVSRFAGDADSVDAGAAGGDGGTGSAA